MPIVSSKNSNWIMDTHQSSQVTTTTNPNEDVFTADLPNDYIYCRLEWLYRRHMVVQSPDSWQPAFGKIASGDQISSGSGNRVFTPLLRLDGETYFLSWQCTGEVLAPENPGDGTFRLEQDWVAISKWFVVKKFVSSQVIYTPDLPGRGQEQDPWAPTPGVTAIA